MSTTMSTTSELTKLTKAQYYKGIMGTGMIEAVWNHTLEEVIDVVESAPTIPAPIYKVKTIRQRSEFVDFNGGGSGGGSRRDTFGKNKYFKKGDFYYHWNNSVCGLFIFINQETPCI